MIKKQMQHTSLKDQLISRANDRLYTFLLDEGNIRGAMVNATLMVNEMRTNHALGILETLVLGHGFIGAALMSGTLKGHDRIVIEIDCSGPIKGLKVETNAFGEVRGFLKNVPIPVSKPLESFNLSPFFGAGFLTVTKYLEDAKHPFKGQVALQHGSIAKDLTHYYLTSEQIPTSMNLSIQFDADGHVTGAGGLFLQVLPGADEKTLISLENLIGKLSSIGKSLSDGKHPEDFIRETFATYSPDIIGGDRVEFMCHCSKDRITDYFLMFSVADLRDILENGPFPVEVSCHYCNSAYYYEKDEIQHIYDKVCNRK